MNSIAPAVNFNSTQSASRAKAEARLAAALVNGGASAAEPRADGRFTVTGRAGDRYTTRVISLDEIFCDCKSGIYRGPSSCWHAASTFLRVIADRSVSA